MRHCLLAMTTGHKPVRRLCLDLSMKRLVEYRNDVLFEYNSSLVHGMQYPVRVLSYLVSFSFSLAHPPS